MSEEVNLILVNGTIVDDDEYQLIVKGLPGIKETREFAQKMAVATAAVLNEVMGGAPTGVVARGSGATDAVQEGIAAAVGTPMTPRDQLPEAIKEALAAMDNCQCPGCVARRAHEEKLASGSNSNAKH